MISEPRHDPATRRLLGWSLRLPDQWITPDVSPVDQPPFDPLEPLDSTRAFMPSSGPEDHAGASDPLDDSEPEQDPWAGSFAADGSCLLCGAPPSRRATLGTFMCRHQIDAGMTVLD